MLLPPGLPQSEPSALQESGRGVFLWRRRLLPERDLRGEQPPYLPPTVPLLHNLQFYQQPIPWLEEQPQVEQPSEQDGGEK